MLLYEYYENNTTDDILRKLSSDFRIRRLERGISRKSISQASGVPTPTIAKFEKEAKISLQSFISLCKALGYSDGLLRLLEKPLYSNIDELEIIKKNKNRKRGRDVFSK